MILCDRFQLAAFVTFLVLTDLNISMPEMYFKYINSVIVNRYNNYTLKINHF